MHRPSKDVTATMRLAVLASVLLFDAGCASYGLIQNSPVTTLGSTRSYSIHSPSADPGRGEVRLYLAFSGGGTRAAALSYGVLKELRDTRVTLAGRSVPLLDEVAAIASVSGGSFTAAYYGLYGDRIFTDYEAAFLRRDVERALIGLAMNPFHWFLSTGRTDWAVEFYDAHIFHGATFADMPREGRPLIIINASDLGYGVRFSFLQEYFNLLCSDLSSFPIARAVAASSAVPLVFNPVVVENFPNCGSTEPDWMLALKRQAEGDVERTQLVRGLETYRDKETRKYVHFVDGGITDNLGLRAFLNIVDAAGGIRSFFGQRSPPTKMVVIAVNASTDPEPAMDRSNRQPSLIETVNAMSDIQLHRYNTETIELTTLRLNQWTTELSTAERPVTPHLIHVTFRDIQDPVQRLFFNRIPTDFALTSGQVDTLIEAGRQLLRNNPEFRRLLSDLQ
jgi:NTE family protein